MAKCPMCKKEISEAANICPHCKCDINKYYDDIKREKERIAAEKAENAKRAAEERKKAEELADRLICPDCGTKVTLEDENCPKCGFPLNDKGERARMKTWKSIQKNKESLSDRWAAPISLGVIVASIIFILALKIDENTEMEFDILKVFIISAIIGISITALAVMPSFRHAKNKKEKNFEQFMIEDENMSATLFVDMIKHGMAHCPYCQRKLTEESLIYGNERKTFVKAIRCEHCKKIIDFPGDRLRKQIEEDQINRRLRRQRWGW